MTSAAELFNTLKYRIVVNPATGTRRYYNHANQLHREDGPAVIYHNGTRKWLLNGMPHRTDGPAVESGSYCEWHIWGTRYTEEKYRQRLKTLGADAQREAQH